MCNLIPFLSGTRNSRPNYILIRFRITQIWGPKSYLKPIAWDVRSRISHETDFKFARLRATNLAEEQKITTQNQLQSHYISSWLDRRYTFDNLMSVLAAVGGIMTVLFHRLAFITLKHRVTPTRLIWPEACRIWAKITTIAMGAFRSYLPQNERLRAPRC